MPVTRSRPLVVFACVQNAGRSQIAAALFNASVDPARARAMSAGTAPGRQVHPEVVRVMAELGIDLAAARPQLLTADLAAGASHLITMGCGEACPFIPGAIRDDWPLPDPHGRSLDEVRAIRDDIRRRVGALIETNGWARPRDADRDAGAAGQSSTT
ncbi:MAG: arsenate reductase ArsC [Vicinamibacterales bacterium]